MGRRYRSRSWHPSVLLTSAVLGREASLSEQFGILNRILTWYTLPMLVHGISLNRCPTRGRIQEGLARKGCTGVRSPSSPWSANRKHLRNSRAVQHWKAWGTAQTADAKIPRRYVDTRQRGYLNPCGIRVDILQSELGTFVQAGRLILFRYPSRHLSRHLQPAAVTSKRCRLRNHTV